MINNQLMKPTEFINLIRELLCTQSTPLEKNIYGLSFNRIEDSVRTRIGEYVKENFPNLLVKQWWKGAQMKDHRKISRWQINQLVTLKIDKVAKELFCQVKIAVS